MKQCAFLDCSKPIRARGWCSTHYARWLKHGDVTVVKYAWSRHVPIKSLLCSVSQCLEHQYCRQFCRSHYRRFNLYGAPTVPLRQGHPKGVPLTEATKSKLSKVRKGRVPWNKGIPHSQETRTKLSNTLTGRKGRYVSDKERLQRSKRALGNKWNAGKNHTEATKLKISKTILSQGGPWIKGRHHTNESKIKIGLAQTGEKHWRWGGGSSRPELAKPWYRKLRIQVLQRDNFTCMLCGTKNKALVAHHVIPKSKDGPDTLENLVCWCIYCHISFHNRERLL